MPILPGDETEGWGRDLLSAALLILLIFAAYARAPWLNFVIYDDPVYVTSNPTVLRGISTSGIRWAFSGVHAANWHPITWLSHMLDVQMYGASAAGHHINNVVLHALNTLLLFALLKRLTRATWPSFFVAALFGLHPLRVESVAWVSERKDVLSTLFLLLTIWFYVTYVRNKRLLYYVLMLVCFALGLMAKPMLVTLPAILLLLDFWPLQRLQRPNVSRAILEKLPLLLLSAAMSAITVFAQRQAAASFESVPISIRSLNALHAYFDYVRVLLWPTGLAVIYPYPQAFPIWKTGLALILLVGVTALAIIRCKRSPYLLVGWLWFLGALVPVIGLVQVGAQARADRYTYVPHIGLLIAVVWGIAEIAARYPSIKPAVVVASLLAATACLFGTWIQTAYWKDSVALFRHAIEVTPCNTIAHVDLGQALIALDKPTEALEEDLQAIKCAPRNPEAHNNAGIAYALLGRYSEAEDQYRAALEINPGFASCHFNWGNLLTKQGSTSRAIEQYQQAVSAQPDFPEAWNNYGLVLVKTSDIPAAVEKFQRAIELDPNNQHAHYNLGISLEALGKPAEAADQFRWALRINPNYEKASRRLSRLEGR